MAKTHTFKELFLNWQKAKTHLKEVEITHKELKFGTHSEKYYQKYVRDAQRAEKYWIEKMGSYGKGTLIQASGQITTELVEGGIVTRSRESFFNIFLMNANTDEVKQYLMARFPNIKKETIELKEFQTGILNV